ncbi:MAG: LamG domain-containing protein [Verrucomicrobia bacterium]|nr:LamG domain-containing protein [Verrucomicrobiota bacterium]
MMFNVKSWQQGLVLLVASVFIVSAGSSARASLLIGKRVRNGDFNVTEGALGAGGDEGVYTNSPMWFNMTGPQDSVATRSQLSNTRDYTRHAVISQAPDRSFVQDTEYDLGVATNFTVGFWWKDMGAWDTNDQIEVRLFVTESNLLAGAQTELDRVVVSEEPNDQWDYFSTVTTIDTATYQGRRLFVSIDASGPASNRFARLDDFVLSDDIRPALITWVGSPYLNSGDKKELMGTGQFDLSGDFVYAENAGGDAVEFQGMDFAADSGNLLPWVADAFHGDVSNCPISAIGGWYVDPLSITLGGGAGEVGGALTIGKSYRVQLFFIDGRTGFSRHVIMDGLGMGRFCNGDGGATTYGDGIVASGTFVAQSTSQALRIELTVGGSQLNALVLHENVAENVTQWNLGEAASFRGTIPIDSAGRGHFQNSNGSQAVVITNTVAPRSNAALRFDGAGGYYGAYGPSFIPTNNVAIEMWVRSTNTTQNADAIFNTANINHSKRLIFHATNGNWGASIDGSWIGGEEGAGQPIVSGKWTHIAVITEKGRSTFYLNGVARSGGKDLMFDHNPSPHIGVAPNATAYFDGDIDQLRVFTFDPDTVKAKRALSINNVLEPPPRGSVFCVF